MPIKRFAVARITRIIGPPPAVIGTAPHTSEPLEQARLLGLLITAVELPLGEWRKLLDFRHAARWLPTRFCWQFWHERRLVRPYWLRRGWNARGAIGARGTSLQAKR